MRRVVSIFEGPTSHSASQKLASKIPILPKDGPAKWWYKITSVLRENGFNGVGKRICIIDTGCNRYHPTLTRQIRAAYNLTREAPGDLHGHGTLVATLAHLVAPHAEIIIIKAFDQNGSCDEATLAQGLKVAESVKPHVVNVSAGYVRRKPDDSHWLDDTAVCNCQICLAAESAAEATGAIILAAAGNIAPSPQWYTWTCPANAADCCPVVGMDQLESIAEFPFTGGATTRAAGVISTVGVNVDSGRWIDRLRRFFWFGDESHVGSSFATPLVSGTAALVAGLWDYIEAKEFFFRNIRDKNELTTSSYGVVQEVLFQDYRGDESGLHSPHLGTQILLEQHAGGLMKKKQYQGAISYYNVEIAIMEAAGGDVHPALIIPLLNIASADLADGSLAHAPSALRRAIAIYRAQPPGRVSEKTAGDLRWLVGLAEERLSQSGEPSLNL